MLLEIATVGIVFGIVALLAFWMLSRLQPPKRAAKSDGDPPPHPPIIDIS
jgi:hypothetical protein